jgi:tetratricopeptide (TPR) repeat protein
VRKQFLVICLLPAIACAVCGLDFSVRPRFFGFFPMGGKSPSWYKTGGGGDLAFDVDISSVLTNPFGLGYTAGLEGGILSIPMKAGDESLSVLSGGIGASFYYYPTSRLLTRAEISFGQYGGTGLDMSAVSWWWRAGAEAGFRFSPAFILSANGGYRYHKDKYHAGAALSGLYAGLTVQFNFETRASAGSIDVDVKQGEPVYPVFSALYRESPAGVLEITNRETAEIRDLRVSFRADRYTASEFECGSVDLIPKGRSASLPLYADFSADILSFTENARISGEALIRYRILGQEKEVVRSARVQVYSRGAFLWNDPAGLAGFVSPTSPEILEYAKYLTGLARNHQRAALNRNHQFAVFLFEGLRASGVRLSDIPESAYREHRSSGSLDTVQFPFQTLSYRTGDLDDLGVLYAALLEAVGIRAAFIPMKDEFITAVSLGISEEAASSLFNGLGRLLLINGEVWLPLGMSAFNGGFTAAWEQALAGLSSAFAGGEEPDFIVLEDAWKTYPPAVFPSQDIQYSQPREAAAAEAADRAMRQYIEAEILPMIQTVSAEARNSPSASLFNRLGNLYMRSGQTGEARTAWERAAGMGSAGAMANLGNSYLLDKNYTAAERWFTQALGRDAESAAAKQGLARVRSALSMDE